jgi:hypothetical protein
MKNNEIYVIESCDINSTNVNKITKMLKKHGLDNYEPKECFIGIDLDDEAETKNLFVREPFKPIENGRSNNI